MNGSLFPEKFAFVMFVWVYFKIPRWHVPIPKPNLRIPRELVIMVMDHRPMSFTSQINLITIQFPFLAVHNCWQKSKVEFSEKKKK